MVQTFNCHISSAACKVFRHKLTMTIILQMENEGMVRFIFIIHRIAKSSPEIEVKIFKLAMKFAVEVGQFCS